MAETSVKDSIEQLRKFADGDPSDIDFFNPVGHEINFESLYRHLHAALKQLNSLATKRPTMSVSVSKLKSSAKITQFGDYWEVQWGDMWTGDTDLESALQFLKRKIEARCYGLEKILE